MLFFSTHALAGFPRDIQKQLNLPEQQLDIGIAALTFAKAIYPDLDIAAYSSRIDLLADRVRQLAGGSQDPEQRIRALNTVIYLHEGIRYDHSPDARSRQEYYFLNGILDTKRGICYTMPLLYMA
ncbi:MAG: transglutaminase family protein, partial [Nevskiales bacterium]